MRLTPDYLFDSYREITPDFLHRQGILLTQSACVGQPVLRNAVNDFFTSN